MATYVLRGSIVADLATLATLGSGVVVLAGLLAWLVLDGGSPQRRSRLVVAATVAALVGPAAAAIGSIDRDDTARQTAAPPVTSAPAPPPGPAQPVVVPEADPIIVDVEPQPSMVVPPVVVDEFCVLAKKSRALHSSIYAGLATARFRGDDVAPMVANLKAMQKVAPAEVSDDVAVMLANYQELQDRASSSALENFGLVAATVSSAPVNQAEQAVNAYVGTNCPV